jgi:hypothetical protein
MTDLNNLSEYLYWLRNLKQETPILQSVRIASLGSKQQEIPTLQSVRIASIGSKILNI